MQVQLPKAEVERAISAPAPASNIELSKVGELPPLERRRIDIENRAFQAPVNSSGAGGGQVTTAHAGQSIVEGSTANLSASQNLTEQLPEEAIQFDDVPTEDFSLPPREATNRSAAQANPPPPTGTTVLTPALVTTQLTSEIALDADSPVDVQFEETFRSSASERSNISTAVLASAPRVVAQVANHLIANINSALMTGERSVELRLDPPELGRVILTLTPADQGISGQVLAERSDTLELLRRSLDELARELHDQGFGDVALSLGAFEDNSDPSRNFAEDAPDEFLGSDVPPDETQTIHLSLTNERLDIRL
jgi:flagellar hook-length control protein FliK